MTGLIMSVNLSAAASSCAWDHAAHCLSFSTTSRMTLVSTSSTLILAAGERHDLSRCHFDGRRATQFAEAGFSRGLPACSDDHHASVRARFKLNGCSGLDAQIIADFFGNSDLA